MYYDITNDANWHKMIAYGNIHQIKLNFWYELVVVIVVEVVACILILNILLCTTVFSLKQSGMLIDDNTLIND